MEIRTEEGTNSEIGQKAIDTIEELFSSGEIFHPNYVTEVLRDATDLAVAHIQSKFSIAGHEITYGICKKENTIPDYEYYIRIATHPILPIMEIETWSDGDEA